MDNDPILVFLTYQTVIAAVILSCALLYYLQRNRQQLKRARKQLQKLMTEQAEREKRSPQLLTSEYLDAQIELCHQQLSKLKQHPIAGAQDEYLLVSMRKKMLQLEREYLLANKPLSPHLLKTRLQAHLHQLADLLGHQRAKPDSQAVPPSASGERVVSALDEFATLRKQLQFSRQRIKVLESQLARVHPAGANRLSDPAFDDRSWRDSVIQSESRVAELHKQIADQRESIFNLRRQLRNQRLGSEQETTETELEKLLLLAERNLDDMINRVQELEAALKMSRESHDQVLAELRELKQGYPDSLKKLKRGDDAALILIERQGESLRAQISDIGLSGMQLAYDRGHGELKRLQAANSEQRRLILSLEERLTDYSEHSEQFTQTAQLIATLKRQLQDSEMCTAVLEAETDELRERIRQLTASIALEPDVKPSVDGAVSAGTQAHDPYLQQLLRDASIERSTLDEMLELCGVLAASNSLESLANHLMNLFRLLGLQGVLAIRGRKKVLWLSSAGAVEGKDKKMMESFRVEENNPWVKVSGGMLMVLEHCSMLFRPSVADETTKTELHAVVSLADALVQRIENSGGVHVLQKRTAELLTELRSAIMNINIQNKYLTEEAQRGVENYQMELNQLLKGLHLSEVQRSCFEEMIRDYQTQMALLFEGNQLIDKAFERLINKLEQPLS